MVGSEGKKLKWDDGCGRSVCGKVDGEGEGQKEGEGDGEEREIRGEGEGEEREEEEREGGGYREGQNVEHDLLRHLDELRPCPLLPLEHRQHPGLGRRLSTVRRRATKTRVKQGLSPRSVEIWLMQWVDLTLWSMALASPPRFGSVPQPRKELAPALTSKWQIQDERTLNAEAAGIDTAASSSRAAARCTPRLGLGACVPRYQGDLRWSCRCAHRHHPGPG
jgi:hypothetical protein